MSYRTDRATKQLKEKYQVILNELLREEANRYCADCEAKGPRWASWNIGVFMCIRCAGIHRNLGVHISRVKSVNLDSWTAEQMESIQKWGNKRAKEHYECYLPADFVLPQGDSAMETLIRNKYERKLYIRKGGEPPPNRNKDKEIKPAQPKKKEKQTEVKQDKLSAIASENKVAKKASQPLSSAAVLPRPHSSHAMPAKAAEAPMVDLLGMSNPTPDTATPQNSAQNDDEFSLFMQAAPATAPAQVPVDQSLNTSHIQNGDSLLLEDKSAKKTTTKDSILSLYQSGSQQQKPMYGVPGGVYMTQQQQPQTGNQQSAAQFPMQAMNQQMMGTNQQAIGMTQQGIQSMRMSQPQMSQMGMSQNQMGMSHVQMGMSQNQMGMSQNQMGMNQNQMGVNQNQMGMNQSQMGMNQNQIGVNQNHMGMNQSQVGMSQSQIGMSQNQMGMNQSRMGMNQNQMVMQNNARMGFANNRVQQNQPMAANMMRLPGQMQHMNIAQNQFSSNQGNQMGFGSTRPQYQAGTLPANLGQAMMSNSYGPNRPTMPSQQPILVNSGYAAGSMATSPNMGHTLSNQLWK